MAPAVRSAAYSARPPGRSRGAYGRHPLLAKPGAGHHHQCLGVPALAEDGAWRPAGGLDRAAALFGGAVSGVPRRGVAVFARLPDEAVGLARHSGAQEALVFRRADGSRFALCRDEVRRLVAALSPQPPPAGRGISEAAPPPCEGAGGGRRAARAALASRGADPPACRSAAARRPAARRQTAGLGFGLAVARRTVGGYGRHSRGSLDADLVGAHGGGTRQCPGRPRSDLGRGRVPAPAPPS